MATAAYVAAAVAWTLIDQMNPSADVIAAGGPIDVDLASLTPGQQIVVRWQSHPIFIADRTPQALQTLQEPQLRDRLRDPDSEAHQQPPYAQNWHRSIKPEFLVLVGICTHLGCIPSYRPVAGEADLAPDWPGGYFCPCHGSRYDLAGRVFQGVPAPYNPSGAALSHDGTQNLAHRRESSRAAVLSRIH
jgi:ubiquinol-cytochrome c reductase iron-sulfur subunit